MLLMQGVLACMLRNTAVTGLVSLWQDSVARSLCPRTGGLGKGRCRGKPPGGVSQIWVLILVWTWTWSSCLQTTISPLCGGRLDQEVFPQPSPQLPLAVLFLWAGLGRKGSRRGG